MVADTETDMTDTTHLEITPPREGSKQAKLVAMLSRKSGVTLLKASEALGWLPHTTSATMTRLRKRGYKIERKDRDGKDSLYVICAEEAA